MIMKIQKKEKQVSDLTYFLSERIQHTLALFLQEQSWQSWPVSYLASGSYPAVSAFHSPCGN